MITTKYLPATDSRGSRIKAIYYDNKKTSVIVPYQYGLNRPDVNDSVANHDLACKALLDKLGIHPKAPIARVDIGGGYAYGFLEVVNF